MRRLSIAGLGLGSLLTACTPEAAEQSRELAEAAGQRAHRGAKRAASGAQEEFADVRERFEIDARVERAREQLEFELGRVATELGQLTEAGMEQGAELGKRVRYEPIAGAAEAIRCRELRCEMSAAFVDILAANPRQLVREMMLAPSEGETGPGLRLSRVREGGVPMLLGLRDGDLLLEINGTPLRSLDALRVLGDALHGREQAELLFERDGVRKTLVIVRVGA